MNDKVIKKTQDTLGKVVKKPPLTEKLLSKPPFRFLHDVMTAVIKNTGFMGGLYPDADLSSENVKEKDSKIAFLQSAIDFVAFVNNKALSARPSKIVAGQEPEKTNEFLQALAEAVQKKVNNEDFVKRFRGGERQGKGKPPSGAKEDHKKKKEDKEGESGSGDKDKRHRSREDRERSHNRERSKDRGKEKDKEKSRDRSSKDQDRERSKGKDRDKERSRERDRDDKDQDRDRDRERRRRHREESRPDDAEGRENNAEAPQADPEQEAPARIPRPSSAKGSRRRHRGDEDEERQKLEEQRREEGGGMNGAVEEDDLPPQVAAARKMARPSSARPAAPRIKRNEAPLDEPPVLGSGGSNVPNVIVDKGADSDDDDLFVTKDDDIHHDDMPVHQTDLTEDGEHGGLVKKILETKKELEGGSQQHQSPAKKVEIEKPAVNDAARRKEREMVQKEVDKLRMSIQTLTRSANPLGKIMDYVQEDLDQMQKELEMWKRENKQNAVALQREQSITEKSIEPLKAQLLQLEQQTQDQLDLLAAVKSNIYRNDAKIEKMLGSITKS